MSTIYAHRGASGYAPENTHSAFLKAIEMGADGIELDVHMTKDGHIVVCHDGKVDRTSDGSGRIFDMTLNELRQLDFGARFDGWQKRETIMTIEEVIELVEPTGLGLNIEFKFDSVIYPDIEKKTAQAIFAGKMGERTIYSSFSHYNLKYMKDALPQVKVGLLYSAALFEPWRYAKYVGADFIHPYFVTLQAPDLVKNCHENGIGVHPWTVNDEKHMQWMCALGADMIITNYPDKARAVRNAMAHGMNA